MIRSAAFLALLPLLGCGSTAEPVDAHVHAHDEDAHVHADEDAHSATDDAHTHAAEDAAVSEDAHVHADPDAQIHAADAQDPASSDAGVAAGVVVTAEVHGAVSRANTHVHIQVTRDGAPLAGGIVTVALWMPAHGHGAPAPTVDDEGGGAYHAIPTFTMAGRWELTITGSADGQSGRVVLGVNVP